MKLIIEGSDKKIKQLAKELRTRASRSNLSISLQETKKQEAVKPSVKPAEKTSRGAKKKGAKT